MAHLTAILDRQLSAIWPRRSQQELLLDLGERKGWTPADRLHALRSLSDWLTNELGLAPASVGVGSSRVRLDRVQVRALGARLEVEHDAGSVARWARALGPALGVGSKALANSLSGGLKPDRPDHRWLLALLDAGSFELDSVLFHRRGPSSVERALAAVGPSPTAADAVLLVSLVALWQRRRPTHSARGNRARSSTRRSMPKPAAALSGTLIQPGQIEPLVHLARIALDAEHRRVVLALVIEAALTEAHLAPHPVRSSATGKSGEQWLGPCEQVLEQAGALLGGDADMFRYRIQRMRAWRDRTPGPAHPSTAYGRACALLEDTRRGVVVRTDLDPGDPGVLMLVPQLRSAGLVA